ncbi:MAG: DUF3793 family protein [Lachnospiraceae bacterium]|nr:DUF3793 family protein [Lachnospiraceae bacterium]
MSFEESLVWHASPTLASIKIANLYNFKFTSLEECLCTIADFNGLMNPKGIYIELVKNVGDFYLIYVYRKSHLSKELGRSDVRKFLVQFGYSPDGDLSIYLNVLKERLALKEEFPHEIGVFLGYPLPEVKAFIEAKGQGSIACGEWKVYHDEQFAKCMFCKYRHCREIYMKVFGEGRRLSDMLISA